jgi:ATP-dependent DNA ligase
MQYIPKKPADFPIDHQNITPFEKILKLHHGQTLADRKYDGFGVKLEISRKPSLFSLNDNSFDIECFPELQEELAKLPTMHAIGELVGKKTRANYSHADEFSAVQLRPKTSYTPNIISLTKEMPLELRIYDFLELKDRPTANMPLYDRRKLIQDTFAKNKSVIAAEGNIVNTPAALQRILIQEFDSGSEGLVVKDLTSSYIPNTRTRDWLKLKRQSTFDLITIGLYQTVERLAQGWPCSNVLGGVLNKDTGMIETFSKITLPSRRLADEVYAKLSKHLAYTWSEDKKFYWENAPGDVKKDKAVAYSDIMTMRGGEMMRKMPFAYVKDPMCNGLVLEASCLNISTGADTWHTCGTQQGVAYTMRQPKFLRMREDKTPREATTTQQILACREL